jgi:hypothetical protein
MCIESIPDNVYRINPWQCVQKEAQYPWLYKLHLRRRCTFSGLIHYELRRWKEQVWTLVQWFSFTNPCQLTTPYSNEAAVTKQIRFCWAHKVAEHTRLLNTSGCWAHKVAEHIRLLSTSGCCAHQVTEHTRLLSTQGCWAHQVAEHTRLLSTQGYWAHQVAEHTRLLSTSGCWAHKVAEHIRLLSTQGCQWPYLYVELGGEDNR